MAEPENLTWGTLEELLLACAVDRHGTNSWGSVAKEMQKRTSDFKCFTSQSCERKYHDLKRRFTSEIDRGSESASPWLDELRRRRIAELKQELERYDLSIVSLQLKVKRLSEERNAEEPSDLSPPLPEDAAKESEEENQSLNVLNSTDRKGEKSEEHEVEDVVEQKSVEAAGHPPADPTEPESEDSSKYHASAKTESAELVESVAESIGGEDDGRLGKETGEAESRDGHSRKKNSVAVEEESAAVKPEWVVDFLEEIGRHKLGSVFERRLDSQGTSSYKKLIRQHVDLGTIRTRVKAGQYAESASKFHCDLLLLVTNATVFFPKTAPEHKAATELRRLVSAKFTNHPSKLSTNPPSPPGLQPHPTPEPNSPPLLKPKLLGTVVASRKGTNIVPRPSVGHTQPKIDDKEKEEEQPEKPSWFSVVTKKRTRDQSLASRGSGADTPSNQSSPDRPSSSKNKRLKTGGREKKRESAANFLNRIKSSASISDLCSIQGGETKGAKSSKEGPSKDQGNASRKGSSHTSAREKGKQRDGPNDEGAKKNMGRPSKKAAAGTNTGKRTRESGGDKAEAAPSKKRSRR